MSSLNQFLNQGNLFWNKLRGTRLLGWLLQPKGLPIFPKTVSPSLGKISQLLLSFPRSTDRLVVDISQIAHVLNLPTSLLPNPDQQILGNKGPEIADMGWPVHCWPAGIELQRLSVGCRKRLYRSTRCIKKPDFFHPQILAS